VRHQKEKLSFSLFRSEHIRIEKQRNFSFVSTDFYGKKCGVKENQKSSHVPREEKQSNPKIFTSYHKKVKTILNNYFLYTCKNYEIIIIYLK